MDAGPSPDNDSTTNYPTGEKAMSLYIIVDPINHVFQVGVLTHFGLLPLKEFSLADFQEFRSKVNYAWELHQKAALQPKFIEEIQTIEAIDKI